DPNRRAKEGAAIGAVAGAILGHQINRDSGRFVGAAVGALAGAAVGDYMDKQQQAFETELAAEQRQHQVEIERLKDQSLKIDVNSEVSFAFDSAALKPAFLPTLDKVAGILKRYNRSVVHVLGYTDNVGSAAYNQKLSERRAGSVAHYLAAQGVNPGRLYTEGRGERDPRASNATAAGRQLNRRVELIIKPVVEGQQQPAYGSPASQPQR
ncbi:MAG: OmpA family protein, partial [Gammaproteobacteria bacterium]